MEFNNFWPGWETVRLIGRGGFSKVYEIKKSDGSGDYRAALKVITIPHSPEEYQSYVDDGYDEQSITSIFKSQIDEIVSEFKLMSQFKGISNIVSYEDHMIVPHDDGKGWDILIRMELLTNLPLYYAERDGLSESDVIRLGIDINNALEMCEQRSIIHRDIKPQNLFVNEFGIYKLGDFGIARTMEHTTKATKVGTYTYMAPEVYASRPYGAQADQYSLGLVMYWLMNERRLPFQPLPPAVPTPSEVSEAQLKRMNGEAIPAPKNASPALAEVILKACSYNPEDRYVSPAKFREALEMIEEDKISRNTSRPVPRHEEISAAEDVSAGPAEHERAVNICTVCGEPLPAHAAFCKKCGTGTGITIGKFDTVCPSCGCVTSSGSVFCSVCGKKLIREEPEKEEQTVNYCSRCGRPLPKSGEPCPYCNPQPAPNAAAPRELVRQQPAAAVYVQQSTARYVNEPPKKRAMTANKPKPQTVTPSAPEQSSRKAVLRFLILSIVGVCLDAFAVSFVLFIPAAACVFAVAGLVVSLISLLRIKKADYSLSGSNMMSHATRLSIGGLIGGGVLLILSIVMIATVGPVMPLQIY